MKSPKDFILGIILIGVILRVSMYYMTQGIMTMDRGVFLSIDMVLIGSVFGLYFSYPLMKHITKSVLLHNKVNWLQDIKNFIRSPASKISKSVSGGFIFALLILLLIPSFFVFLDLISVDYQSYFMRVKELIILANRERASDGIFKYLMYAISMVPINWIINSLFVSTFFSTRKGQMLYIRAASSIVLIIISFISILDYFVMILPPELTSCGYLVGSAVLIYFSSMLCVCDHVIRENERNSHEQITKDLLS